MTIRTGIILLGLCYCILGFAGSNAPLYQIDLIVFTHERTSNESAEESIVPVIASAKDKAIHLSSSYNDSNELYALLPASLSQLKKEYWALSHRPEYQVLGHYSWRQSPENQKTIVLPPIHHAGFDVEGVLKVRQRNYYVLNADLKFTTLDKPSSFVLSQSQRLKEDVVYYLDHPKAGMLIKIHKVI